MALFPNTYAPRNPLTRGSLWFSYAAHIASYVPTACSILPRIQYALPMDRQEANDELTEGYQPSLGIVFPVLPPALDGIGDHTAHLARHLAECTTVRVFTASPDAAPIAAVDVVQDAFTLPPARGIRALHYAVLNAPPDWLLIQFNQFSYGRWGLNPFLPYTLHRIMQALPDLKVAVLFHEDFVPVNSWRNAIMSTWQRSQFWALGSMADLVLFSIDPWVDEYRSWFPDTPVRHLPVGSNMPHLDRSKDTIRKTLGISEKTTVLGYFGTVHGSRRVSLFNSAVRAARRAAADLKVLYVGTDGTALRAHLPDDVAFHDAGPLPAEEVSKHLTAMDILAAPIVDGVSTRRGAFLAGLQHGIASVSTKGTQTDALLCEADGDAFLLADEDDPAGFARCVQELVHSPTQRQAMGQSGQALYTCRFSWPVIAQRLLGYMHEVDHPVSQVMASVTDAA